MLRSSAFTGRNVTSAAGSRVREQPQPTHSARASEPKETPFANREPGGDLAALTAFPSHPLGSASRSLPLAIYWRFLSSDIMAGNMLTHPF